MAVAGHTMLKATYTKHRWRIQKNPVVNKTETVSPIFGTIESSQSKLGYLCDTVQKVK